MSSEESFNRSESHKLCANGCGFFGTAATMNLCSKCFRDFKVKEEQESKAKAAFEKSLNPPSLKAKTPIQPVEKFSIVDETVSGGSGDLESTSIEVVKPEAVKNRCLCCNKRVGLTGFKCRCGSTFCSTHRYPENHECSFDFKGVGRDAISKANPVVKADKVERF